jgi:hypothetical protein
VKILLMLFQFSLTDLPLSILPRFVLQPFSKLASNLHISQLVSVKFSATRGLPSINPSKIQAKRCTQQVMVRSDVSFFKNSDIQECFAPSATDAHMIKLGRGYMVVGIPGLFMVFFVGKQSSSIF